MEKIFELISRAPFWDEVLENDDPEKEHIQDQDYKAEERLRKLKGTR